MNREEVFNSVTHIVGAALAMAGLVALVVSASLRGDPALLHEYVGV